MFDVSFDGIGTGGTVTFLKGAGVTVDNEDHVGKISGSRTVDACDAEDVFYGVIGRVDEENGILGLERKGMNEVAYTGAVSAGWVELVADGSGGVKEPATAGTGRTFHVVDVNETDSLLMLDLG